MATVPTTPQSPLLPVPEEVFGRVWQIPKGIWGWLTTVQNTPIGIRFIYTSFLFFVLGGISALIMRTQLAQPENDFIDPQTYNRLMTVHGSTMMFLFMIPLIEGLATLTLPQMLGSRELPFPRLTAFSYWVFLLGGLIFYASFLFDAVPETGWFAYTPLSDKEYSPDEGMDFWLLGLNVAEVGAIAGAFEIILAFFKCRAPGMSLNRIPIYVWAMLVTAFMMIFGFTPLIVGSTLLELDRLIGTHFYKPETGGDPLLWQHVFWIFGHPDVYIMFIPAVGIVSTIVAVFSQRALIGHNFVVMSLVATGFLSFGLWVHHMFATGLPQLSLSFFTAASMLIAIPSGVQIFAWIATIWTGRPVFKTPFLFILGFFFIFVLGGITGVMVAIVPFDLQAHDSYFVVAHFHYVLIGGALFPFIAGLYYWSPKIINKMLNERLGRINFWLVFIGFNVTFFPMHISGLLGMPRRVYTYQADLGWTIYNQISTVGAFILALGILTFIINVIYSLHYEPDAEENPWNADTLEWATPTPVPQYGFRYMPIVHSRHPLWEQNQLHEGNPRTEKIVEALAQYPLEYRAQLTVSALDGEPEAVFRVASDSIFPLVVGISVMLLSFFLIFHLFIPSLIALLLSVVGLIGWHIQDRWTVPRNREQERHFEATVGIPIYYHGSPAIAHGAMLLTLAALAVAMSTLFFSYFYLRLNAIVAGVEQPETLLAGIATLIVILLAGGNQWLGRQVRQSSSLRVGLLIIVILALGGTGLHYLELRDLPFNYDTDAYGSLFYVITAAQMLLIITGAGMSALTAAASWEGEHQVRRQRAVKDIGLFWIFTAISGLLVFLILHFFPFQV